MRAVRTIASVSLLLAVVLAILSPAAYSATSSPFATDSGEDPDGDGLRNSDEAEAGTRAENPATDRDTDGDGVWDGEDGWGLVAALAPGRLARPSYAIVEIGPAHSYGQEINNAGKGLIWNSDNTWTIWAGGTSTPVGSPPSRTIANLYGLSEDGRLIATTADPLASPLETEAWIRSGTGTWTELPLPESLLTVRSSMEQANVFDGSSIYGFASGPGGSVYGIASVGAVTGGGSASVYATFQWSGTNVTRIDDQIGMTTGEAQYQGHDFAVQSFTADLSPFSSASSTVPTQYASDGKYRSQIQVNANDVMLSMRHSIDALLTANDIGGELPPVTGGTQRSELMAGEVTLFDFGSLPPPSGSFAISSRNTVSLKQPSGAITLWIDSNAGLRNDQPVGSAPEFSRLDWQQDFGDPPPLHLNAQMRGISGTRIWQNGRWIDIAAVVSAAQRAAATWTGITAADQNDFGLIIGAATKTAGGATHAVLLVPFELIDTKDKVFDDQAPQGTTITDAMRDVNVEPKKDADDKNSKSIAWIEPHGSDNEDTVDAPDMPQLALRFRGTEQMGLKIKWKLEVIYDRPRGDSPDNQRIKEQDEVFIPKKSEGNQPWKEEALTGAVKLFDHPDWNAELQEKGFFGGEAKLTYQLLKADGGAISAEETMLFSIGGKNPDPVKCKDYIGDSATSAHGNMWFAYAIAKSESSAFNPERRYNQFWERTGRYDKRPHKRGEPTWAKASWEESAGGFGLFQVTGRVQNTPQGLNGKFYNIDRQEIWNWQKHVLAGLAIIRSKQDVAYDGTWDYMNGSMPHRKMAGQPRGQRAQARQSNNGNDVPVPNEVVRSVTFRDGTARPIESAVTIKAYNGAARHYVGWNNATKKWEFFRTNGIFNYVDRVCQEVE